MSIKLEIETNFIERCILIAHVQRSDFIHEFVNILKENEQIVLGHHSDDVAETIFMRILRGTGLDGIEGPARKRNIGKGKLIRPLIRVPKIEIMSYLRDNKLNFIEDDTNEDIRFDRNFLRHKIFPLLEDRWKDFPKRINALS